MTAETPDKQAERVAILVTNGFEQAELEEPRKALDAAGFVTDIVSPAAEETVQGYHHAEKGDAFPIDVKLGRARPENYAALLLPGGVQNPDALRQNKKALDFVRHFVNEGKPVAAICHGPWTLIDAGVVAGRRLTSWGSIKTDLINAGAQWTDEEVVVDDGLVTSRCPEDLPAFCKKIVEVFRAGPYGGSQKAAAIAKVGELIKDIQIAMLTTVQADGTLRSRPMATLGHPFDGTLWFFISVSSHKSAEVEGHHHVTLGYADPANHRYVSVNGRANIVRDREKAAKLWTPYLQLWFPNGLEDPDLGLLQVEAESAEYWDIAANRMAGIIAMAKSLLKRQPYRGDSAEHQLIELYAATLPNPEGAELSSEKKNKKPTATLAKKKPTVAARHSEHRN